MRHTYEAYGLILDSDSELPFFTKVTNGYLQSDVNLTLNGSPNSIPLIKDWKRSYPTQDSELHGIQVWASDEWLRIEYPITQESILKFYLSKNGKQLIADKPESMLFSDMQSFVLGSTFGCILRRHRRICLHASVLSYNDKAFALIGHKGAGKSTTAAALLGVGAQLISDDIAVLDFESDHVMVEVGYPAVRLLPNSLEQYTNDQSQFRKVVSFSDKRYVALPSSGLKWKFNSKRLALEAIYILNTRNETLDSTRITPLSRQESLMAISPHSYTNYILDEAQKKLEFKMLAKISRRISIKSISCKNSLTAMPDIALDIVRDFKKAH